jgi:prophage tail gpP-like protein
MSCVVSIGGDAVISGYVDHVIDRMTDTEHVLTLTGRGMTEDLVDCAAVWQGAMFSNVTALDIATKVAAPYGIVAVTDESDLRRLPIMMVNLGETAFEIIDRVCKLSGLLAFEQPNGTLLLTRVGTAQAASGFQQGTNVQEASLDNSMDQRFSDYTVVYPGNQVLGDVGASPLTTYTYKDSGVPRYRQKYIELLSNSVMTELSQQQAMWEMNRRIGRSQVVRVTADSWRDSDGTLWTPNTLAPVELAALKVPKTQLLVGEVTFKLGLDTGTTVEVELMPPAAFDVEPIPYLPIPMDVQNAQGAR